MSLKQIKRGAIAVGLAAVLGAVPLAAQGMGMGGPGGRHFGWGGFGSGLALDQLGLSDDQRQQIQTAVSGHRDEFRALGQRLRAARQAQESAIAQVPMNEQQVRAASMELAGASADMAVLRARIHEQVFSMLTPDQQAKAAAIKAERAQRRAQWKAERQPQPQQPAAPKQ